MHYLQGTQVLPRELRILLKQIASVKSDWPLKIESNTRPSLCVPGHAAVHDMTCTSMYLSTTKAMQK